jgi:Ca2+/H+ antiporter, TMEM165/GDT1 family
LATIRPAPLGAGVPLPGGRIGANGLSIRPAGTRVMEPFLISTIVVGAAEIGDKSLLLGVLLVMRYRCPGTIFAGMLVGLGLNLALAALLGAWLGSLVNGAWLDVAMGFAFIGMAAWMLCEQDTDAPAIAPRGGVFVTSAIGFFALEMADKTQLATLALAASYQALVPVALGAFVGVTAVNAPVLWLGNRFATRLPVVRLRRASALLFAALGVWLLLGAY